MNCEQMTADEIRVIVKALFDAEVTAAGECDEEFRRAHRWIIGSKALQRINSGFFDMRAQEEILTLFGIDLKISLDHPWIVELWKECKI